VRKTTGATANGAFGVRVDEPLDHMGGGLLNPGHEVGCEHVANGDEAIAMEEFRCSFDLIGREDFETDDSVAFV
jgi:hypothetical protein